MARNTQTTKAVGIVLVIVGAGLAYWGYQMSGSVGAQLQHAFAGSHSDDIMIRYIAGAASFAAGLFLILKK